MQQRGFGENIITATAVGGALIIIGLVFLLTPNLAGQIGSFFSDFTWRPYSDNSTINLPVPANLGSHTLLYSAAAQFALGIGILQIIILAMRFGVHSRIGKIAETVGNLVFWFGAYYLASTFLTATVTYTGWFAFWASLIIAVGLSIVVRGIILLARRKEVPR
jgi:hypothetical protein